MARAVAYKRSFSCSAEGHCCVPLLGAEPPEPDGMAGAVGVEPDEGVWGERGVTDCSTRRAGSDPWPGTPDPAGGSVDTTGRPEWLPGDDFVRGGLGLDTPAAAEGDIARSTRPKVEVEKRLTFWPVGVVGLRAWAGGTCPCPLSD